MQFWREWGVKEVHLMRILEFRNLPLQKSDDPLLSKDFSVAVAVVLLFFPFQVLHVTQVFSSCHHEQLRSFALFPNNCIFVQWFKVSLVSTMNSNSYNCRSVLCHQQHPFGDILCPFNILFLFLSFEFKGVSTNNSYFARLLNPIK